MPEGLETLSLSEAFAQAVAETSVATPVDDHAGQPPVGTQATGLAEPASLETSEQPAAIEGETFDAASRQLADQLLGTEITQDGSDSGIAPVVPGSDEFLNLPVEVKTPEGPTTVTVKELTDGYLRQADYTRKTQAIAEQRKYTERAEEFFNAFSEDPAGFSYSLAVQAGLVTEGDTPARNIPSAKIPTAEEIDAQVEELVKSRIEADPRIQSAAMRDAEAQIDAEFDRIQTKHGIPLSVELRKSLIQEAYKTGSSDLEGILAKRLLTVQQQQSKAGATRAAATSRPGVSSPGATEETDTTTPPKSIRESWQQAKVIAAQQ